MKCCLPAAVVTGESPSAWCRLVGPIAALAVAATIREIDRPP
jgi:hypothetical protein